MCVSVARAWCVGIDFALLATGIVRGAQRLPLEATAGERLPIIQPEHHDDRRSGKRGRDKCEDKHAGRRGPCRLPAHHRRSHWHGRAIQRPVQRTLRPTDRPLDSHRRWSCGANKRRTDRNCCHQNLALKNLTPRIWPLTHCHRWRRQLPRHLVPSAALPQGPHGVVSRSAKRE